MTTLAVISQAKSAQAVTRWAARLAKARADSLVVLCCLFDTIDQPPEPLESRPDLGHSALVKCTLDAIQEFSDIPSRVLVMRNSKPTSVVVRYIEDEQISFLCAGLDSAIGREDPVNRLAYYLLHYAPCDLFLLDPGDEDGSKYQRIVFPLGMHSEAFSLRLAVDLAKCWDGTVFPVEAGSFIGSDSKEIARRIIATKLQEAGIEDCDVIHPTVTVTREKWRAVMKKGDSCDLVLMGAKKARSLIKLRFEEQKKGAPEGSRVSIGLVRPGKILKRQPWFRIDQWFMDWLPTLQTKERIDLFDRLHVGARWNVDFIMMICLSTAIASLGLIQNSPAVVIGAMVVAPLMTPLIGAGMAIIQSNLGFFRDSLRAMGFGIGAALVISLIIGFIVPLEQLTPELLARGAPTVIDLAVAFLSGTAAAYAMARPSLLGALAGVAIAAALVPPLATIGISLAHGVWEIAEGAAMLFATNLVAIILGAAWIYRHLGIKSTQVDSAVTPWFRRMIIALVVLSVILAGPLGYRLNRQLIEGQTRPYSLPVSESVHDAIFNYVHQQYGLNLIAAARVGVESDIDVVVVLSAAKPVSEDLIAEVQKVVDGAMEENVSVAVYVIQEAAIEKSVEADGKKPDTPAAGGSKDSAGKKKVPK